MQQTSDSHQRYLNVRNYVFHMVDVGFVEDMVCRSYDLLNFALIIVNLLITIFYTYDNIATQYAVPLHVTEEITVAFFAVDYVLRVWTAPDLHPHDSNWKARRKYIFSLWGLIDLVSFLPFYMPWFFPSGTVAFRLFRITRLFRLFRINKYYDSLSAIMDVLRSKRQQLWSSIFLIFILMLASSLSMYSIENKAQPDVFENAFSGIWWAASTLLTVGYGDIYPITTAGKALGILITFLGVLMVAIPTGIISAGFVEQYQNLAEKNSEKSDFDLYFIKLKLERDDAWVGMKIKDIHLPGEMNIAVIQRGRETVVPRGDVVLETGDILIVGAESARDEWSTELKEMTLQEGHPWCDERICDLDISRHTFLVLVRRGNRTLTPNGKLVLKAGDDIVLYSQKHIADVKTLKI